MEEILTNRNKELLTLAERMKEYEDITRYKLSKGSYILGRIDGNCFKTYTKNLKRPYDSGFIEDMNEATKYLCEKIQNIKFAYVQSDEISLFLHESNDKSQPWFDNNLQKMASISASKTTTEFNRRRMMRNVEQMFSHSFTTISASENKVYDRCKEFIECFKMGEFDARFWTVPSAIEVFNYFLHRQRDAEKNSISSAAQTLFSPLELEKKNGSNKIEMMKEKNVDWNNYEHGEKYGRFIEKVTYINGKPGKILILKEKSEEDVVQYILDGDNYENYSLLQTVQKILFFFHVDCVHKLLAF